VNFHQLVVAMAMYSQEVVDLEHPQLHWSLSAISNQQSAISNQQSAISNQQSAISNQQSAISNLYIFLSKCCRQVPSVHLLLEVEDRKVVDPTCIVVRLTTLRISLESSRFVAHNPPSSRFWNLLPLCLVQINDDMKMEEDQEDLSTKWIWIGTQEGHYS
jgi:hypothetical protein